MPMHRQANHFRDRQDLRQSTLTCTGVMGAQVAWRVEWAYDESNKDVTLEQIPNCCKGTSHGDLLAAKTCK